MFSQFKSKISDKYQLAQMDPRDVQCSFRVEVLKAVVRSI